MTRAEKVEMVVCIAILVVAFWYGILGIIFEGF